MASKRDIYGGYLPPSAPQNAFALRTRLSGDRTAAGALLQNVLKFVVPDFIQAGQFQNLQQNKKVITYPDGSVVHLRSVFGTVTVDVHSPIKAPVAPPEREAPEEERFEEVLPEPRFVLGIKIIGIYYTGVVPETGAYAPGQEDQYIVWDTAAGSMLPVLKDGGPDYWEYPIADTDYEEPGDFWSDFQTQYGAWDSNDTPPPLLQNFAVVSDMTNQGEFGVLFDGSGFLLDEPDNPIPEFPCTINCGEYEDEDAAIAALNACMVEAVDNSVVNSYPETQQAVLNAAGTDDVWTEAQFHSDGVIISATSEIDDHCEFGIAAGRLSGEATHTATITWTRTLEFTAPVGGLTSEEVDFTDFYVGLRPDEMPLPVTARALRLVLQNASGGDDVVYGPAIAWEGSLSYSFVSTYYNEQLWAGGKLHTENQVVSTTQTGAGTVTLLDGTVVAISAENLDSGGATWDGDAWSSNYERTNSVTYSFSDLRMDSGYDTDDNFQFIILIETQETGTVENTLEPAPPPPYFDPTETSPVVSGQAVRYNLASVKVGAVPDAATFNPWHLPENWALRVGLHTAIEGFLAANPPDAGDRWVLYSSVTLFKWED